MFVSMLHALLFAAALRCGQTVDIYGVRIDADGNEHNEAASAVGRKTYKKLVRTESLAPTSALQLEESVSDVRSGARFGKGSQAFTQKGATATGSSPIIIGAAAVVVLLIGVGIFIFMSGKDQTKKPAATPKAKAKAAAATPKAKAKAKAAAAKPKAKAAAAKATAAPTAARVATSAAAVATSAAEKDKHVEHETMTVKAAMLIQRMFRCWKARKELAALKKNGGMRAWSVNQNVYLMVEVLHAHELPNVSMFGGIAPFVETRLVLGNDPSHEKQGNVYSAAKEGLSVQTDVRAGEANPSWKGEEMYLKHVTMANDTFLQVIMWNHAIGGNTASAHFVQPITEILSGVQYDPKGEDRVSTRKKVDAKMTDLVTDGAMEMKARLELNFSYWEVVKWNFVVVKGSRVPKIKSLGGIDSFVEIRVVKRANPKKEDLKKSDFTTQPDKNCIWSHSTSVASGSIDPEWKETLEVALPGDPLLQMQIILWDASSMGNTPICHCVMGMKGLLISPMGEVQEHKLKFDKLPAVAPAGDFKKTTVTMKMKHDQDSQTNDGGADSDEDTLKKNDDKADSDDD